MKPTWTRAGENLVRHSGGVLYLQAKVGGKSVRVSLQTRDIRIAKLRRGPKLQEVKAAAAARAAQSGAGKQIRTMGQAIDALHTWLMDRPDQAPGTLRYHQHVTAILRDTLPVTIQAKTWTAAEASRWWMRVAARYSASVANKVLAGCKKLCAILIETGIRSDDPTRDLKRIRERKQEMTVPSYGDMTRIIDAIRNARKRGCADSARWVAVAAFSGMRKGEMAQIRWEDIGPEWLTVGADGQTKSRRFRRVPVSQPLRDAIEEIRQAMADCGAEMTGTVFRMASPRRALHSACAAAGVSPMRVHDLRHFFATWCIERGVDIPTVAKWLGHSDGGALAMRTYGHVRDEHSLRAVALLAAPVTPADSGG